MKYSNLDLELKSVVVVVVVKIWSLFILLPQFGFESFNMVILVLFILPVADQFSSAVAKTY